MKRIHISFMSEKIKNKVGRPRKYNTPEERREGRRLLQIERRRKMKLNKLLGDSSSEQKQE